MVLLLKASHEDKDQLVRQTASQPDRQTDKLPKWLKNICRIKW